MPLPFQSAKTVPTICPVPRERVTAAAAACAARDHARVPVEKFCDDPEDRSRRPGCPGAEEQRRAIGGDVERERRAARQLAVRSEVERLRGA